MVVALIEGPDAGFVPFSDPTVATPTDVGAFLASHEAPSSGCFVYYQAANCRSPDALGLPPGTAFDENPACRELERRATLVPILAVSVPARPYRGERYSVDPIPVGFYRIEALSE
jgi:hypothetical protein